MDGGSRQEEMAERIKREIKDKAQLRREERAMNTSPGGPSIEKVFNQSKPASESPKCLPTPICEGITKTPNAVVQVPLDMPDVLLPDSQVSERMPVDGSDTVMLMFYIDNLLPFMFPYYRPSLVEGGRAWVHEVIMRSPIIRQTAFCLCSYFYSIAQGWKGHADGWDIVLRQTNEAFVMLGQALQIINNAGVSDHLHGAVRILASIMQLQCFEIAILSFENCQAHLNAAIALVHQLLGHNSSSETVPPRARFDSVLERLGHTSMAGVSHNFEIPRGEHVAFRFSTTLLLWHDIMASIVLQEEPRLHDYHYDLLSDRHGPPALNLEAVIGCRNWVLLHIGLISALDAWKQRCKRAGTLDLAELVHRANIVKESMEVHHTRLVAELSRAPEQSNESSDIFGSYSEMRANTAPNQTFIVTRIWVHAASLYLYTVVSGWQTASPDVRYHVGRILDLLTYQLQSRSLLRTVVWPFCVAGCLAEPSQEQYCRGLVEELQPASIFATVHKALEIMENVWRNRGEADAANRDISTCLRSQGDLVLLL